MNLDRLKIFYHCAKAKSFSHTTLSLSPSAISRQVSQLEHDLRAPLFHRLHRALVLTDQGEALFKVADEVFTKLNHVEDVLNQVSPEPEGTLRLAIPGGWPTYLLLNHLAKYLEKFPKVHLQILSTDEFPDFSQGYVDAALFPYIPDQGNLKHIPLHRFTLKLFASPSYIQKRGLPKTQEDLSQHQLITLFENQALYKYLSWHLKQEGSDTLREPYMRINNLFEAVSHGFGIAPLAFDNPAIAQMGFVQVLPELSKPLDTYFVYPAHLGASPRLKSLEEFLTQILKAVIEG